MIGRKFIIKNAEIFSEQNAKISPENVLPLPINRKKNELISLSYDVNNDVVYSKSKPIQL